VVGLGYVWLGPWVMGKQPDGTPAWYTALLLMPYFGAAEFAWYLVRVLGGEEPWHEVSRGLFLGRRVQHWEVPARIGLVLDMTAEFVEPVELRTGRKYVCVPTFDASAPDPRLLADAIEAIAPYQGNIYVHCAAGNGRSAMAMAVLMVARGLAADLEEAVAMMCAARTRVKLRTTQKRVARAAIELLRARGVVAAARAR
jgi:protein-tyrosine phosphatase